MRRGTIGSLRADNPSYDKLADGETVIGHGRPQSTVNDLARVRSEQLFLSRIPTSGGLFACWQWQGPRGRQGYGRHGSGAAFGGEIYAHRIAWWLANGRPVIPLGWEVDHLCFTHDCVNPLHLRCVPLALNRRSRRRTHCRRGHLLDEANTYVRPADGSRHCRTCWRASIRRWHHRNRDEQNARRRERRQRTGR